MGHNFGNGVPRKIVICEDGRYCLFESIFFQWGEVLSHGLSVKHLTNAFYCCIFVVPNLN